MHCCNIALAMCCPVAVDVDAPYTWSLLSVSHSMHTFRPQIRDQRSHALLLTKCHVVDNHAFWNKAVALLDPLCAYNHLTIIQPTPTTGSNGGVARRISMWQHYRNMFDVSCVVCRVNFGKGLTRYRTSTSLPLLSPALCGVDYMYARY